jgi:endonuclease/exonuclease/phosphatase (EEP) superfamily protein YafD
VALPGFLRSVRQGGDHPRTLTVVVRAAVWLYLVLVLAVTAALLFLSDRWWPITALLFSPRWVWAPPLAPLAAGAALYHRRALIPVALTAFLVLFPIMGLQVPSPTRLFSDQGRTDLRVMTYNIGGGEIDPAGLAPLLEETGADVALFQECQAIVEKARPSLEQHGFHVDAQYGSCIASRFPIGKIDVRDPRDVWRMNGSGVITRYEIAVPGIPLNVVNVHLETVRDGLTAVMRRAPWKGAARLEENIRQRDFESSLGRAWTERATGPLVITGDFNMPFESAIYQRYWSSFTNAFSAAGLGFGHTKETRWHGIRIDHVLLGPGWECVGAHVGRHLGGDHRPMIAYLHLRR